MTSRPPTNGRSGVGLALGCLVVLGLTPFPPAHADAPPAAPHASASLGSDAETALADQFRPVIGIQTQATPCGPGEPYLPTDALAAVGRADVVLRDASGQVITTAPTAADIASAPADANIDFPGDSLRPGCDFERWFRQNGTPPPSVYAHVFHDPEHAELTIVQYWMFWIYNDWNNRHEGDWEMMQLVFDAPTAEAALTLQPVDVVLSQHEGAERRTWDRVQQSDGRPVVYPAGGSHAVFFEQDRYLGKSAEAGFGCDDTRSPSTMLDPAVVLVPDTIDAGSEFSWLQWEGRWGERQRAFNNGPQGPLSKRQWTEPIGWMDDIGRSYSLRAPSIGNDVTDFFCAATEKVSMFMLRVFHAPWVMGGLLAIVIIAIVLVARRTAWSPVVRRPIASSRRSGQILRSAAAVAFAERRRFAPVSLLVIGAGVFATVFRQLLFVIPVVGDVDRWLHGDGWSRLILALLTGSLITVPVTIYALALATAMASDLDGVGPDQRTRLSELRHHRGVWVVAAIVALVFLVLGPLTFLIGVYFAARWAAAPSLAVRDGSGFRASLRNAAELSRGHRLRTGVVALTAALITIGLGIFIGALVLIATGAGFGLVNLIDALITAALVPWFALVIVMLHQDLEKRAGSSGTVPAAT